MAAYAYSGYIVVQNDIGEDVCGYKIQLYLI